MSYSVVLVTQQRYVNIYATRLSPLSVFLSRTLIQVNHFQWFLDEDINSNMWSTATELTVSYTDDAQFTLIWPEPQILIFIKRSHRGVKLSVRKWVQVKRQAVTGWLITAPYSLYLIPAVNPWTPHGTKTTDLIADQIKNKSPERDISTIPVETAIVAETLALYRHLVIYLLSMSLSLN